MGISMGSWLVLGEGRDFGRTLGILDINYRSNRRVIGCPVGCGITESAAPIAVRYKFAGARCGVIPKSYYTAYLILDIIVD